MRTRLRWFPWRLRRSMRALTAENSFPPRERGLLGDRKFESIPLQRRVLCEPLFNARQTGLDKQQAVQEKPALLACYREGINAHLMAEET